MLKISITETTTDRRWILEGRLVGPWVGELRATWKREHRGQDGRACIIDLNDVTFIDKSGERLLRALSKKGAQLLARGVYINHVLEQLKTGKRGLVTLFVCLFLGLQTNVIVPITPGQVPSAGMERKVKELSGLRFNLADSRSRSTGNFQFDRSRSGTMTVELMDGIGGANATRSSADRTERTENQ